MDYLEDCLEAILENPGSTILAIVIVYLIWRIYNQPRNLPPGPRPWPLIGNPDYFQDNEEQYLDYQRLGKEYGDVASLYFGKRLMVILNRHEVIRDAWISRGLEFQDRDPAILGNDYVDFYDEVFNCPLTEDYHWKKKFAVKAMKLVGFGTKASEGRILREVNELLSYVDKQKGQPFDIEEALINLHTNVIFQILISKRHPWFSEEIKREIAAAREFYSVTAQCADPVLDIAHQYFPMWFLRLVFRKLLAKLEKGFKNSQSIVREAIEEKMKEKDKLDPENPRDFLEVYITQRKDFDLRVHTNTMSIFIPDATDTLSTLGLWTLLHLAYNPDVQKKCQEQIDEMCGSRQPNLDDRPNLSWVEAAIWEAVRLGVPLPISLAHIVTKDLTFRGYTIPHKNTCVVANFYAASRDPEVFPNPEKYDPKRFLDENGKFHRSDSVMSFGIGKRMCVGKAMAETELFLLISSLMQRFTLSFPAGEPTPTTKAMKANMFRKPFPFSLVAKPR